MWQGDWTSFKEESVKMLVCTHHSEENLNYLVELCASTLMKIAWYSRIRVLDPFLFYQPYRLTHLKNWAIEGNLLPMNGKCFNPHGKLDEATKETIILCDTVAYHTTEIIKTFLISGCGMCKDFKVDFNKKCEVFQKSTFEQCIKHVQNDDIFILVQKHLPQSSDKRMTMAAFLITYIICNEALKESDSDMIPNFEHDCLNVTKIECLKEKGNSKYHCEKYDDAIHFYTEAIKASPHNSVLYGNRAQSYLKLSRGEEAEMDVRRSLVLNPDWGKAYYRLAQSLEIQGNVHKAQIASQYGLYRCKYLAAQSNIYQELKLYNKDLIAKCSLATKNNHSMLKNELNTKIKESSFQKGHANIKKNSFRKMYQSYDVPELTDPSNSDDSDSSPSDSFNKKEVSYRRKDSLKQIMADGSTASLAGCFDIAVNCFHKALEKIKSEESSRIEEKDLISLKYSYGMACVESCDIENLQKGISSFIEILENHNDVRCPSAYYGLGVAYFKINNFKTSIAYLQTGLSILKKGIRYTPLIWPCTTNIIQETRPEKLEEMFESLITKCKYPPPPVAVCRYKECNFNKSIYYSDLGFKGFVTTTCQQCCNVTYHPVCWKTLKESFCRTDKDFLEQRCLTPDCDGLIINIKVIDQNGATLKQFSNELARKCQRPRKSKLEKKMELKELRKKRRVRDHTNERNSTTESKESTNNDIKEIASEETASQLLDFAKYENSPVCKNTVKRDVPHSPGNSQPFYILKKENNEVENIIVSKRERKKPKLKNTMSVGKFYGDVHFPLCSEYEMRLDRLRKVKEMAENCYYCPFSEAHQVNSPPKLDPSNPFYNPYNLHNNPKALEEVLQSYSKTEVSDPTADMKENIFLYMEDILKYEGPVHKDDPLLTEQLNSFPSEAQELINSYGGLNDFLLQSIKFAVVKDYICVSSDVLKAYKLTSGIMALKFSSDNIESDEEYYFSPEEVLSDDKCLDWQLEEMAIGKSPSSCNFTSDATFTNESSCTHYSEHHSHYYYDPQFLGNDVNYISYSNDAQFDDHSSKIISLNDTLNSDKSDSAQLLNYSFEQIEHSDITEVQHKSNDSSIVDVCMHNNQPVKNKMNTSKVLGSDANDQITWYSKTKNAKAFSQSTLAVDSVHFLNVPKHKFSLTRSLSNGPLLLNMLEKMFKYFQNNRSLQNILLSETCSMTVLPPLKENKCLQVGSSMHSFNSIGVMKDDEEFQFALNEVEDLTKAKIDTEEKLNSALHKVSIIENKYITEINALKKQLEETHLELLKEQNKGKTSLSAWESENQRQISHTEVMQELNICKKELEKKNDDLKRAENKSKILADLNHCIQSELKTEKNSKNELQETLQSVMKMCEEHCEMAKLLKLEFLNFQREEGFKQKERAVRYAEENIRQLHSSLNDSRAFFFFTPVIVKAIEEWTTYKNKVEEAHSDFMKTLDLHISSLEDGTAAKPLNVQNILSLPDPPLVPSFSSPFLLQDMQLPNPPSTSLGGNIAEISNSALAINMLTHSSTAESLTSKPSCPPGLNDIFPEINNSLLESTNDGPKINLFQEKTLGSNDSESLSSDSSNQLHVRNSSLPTSLSEIPQHPAQQSTKSSEKVLLQLRKHFPCLNEEQLASYLKVYRSKHKKLTGMTISSIITGVRELVEKDCANHTGARPRPRVTSQIRKISQLPSSFSQNKENREEKKDECLEYSTKAWNTVKTNPWSGDDSDGSCSICLEKITKKSAYKVDCNHVFHYKCITEWLTKQSTCPICRVYILLPDEFPALG